MWCKLIHWLFWWKVVDNEVSESVYFRRVTCKCGKVYTRTWSNCGWDIIADTGYQEEK